MDSTKYVNFIYLTRSRRGMCSVRWCACLTSRTHKNYHPKYKTKDGEVTIKYQRKKIYFFIRIGVTGERRTLRVKVLLNLFLKISLINQPKLIIL